MYFVFRINFSYAEEFSTPLILNFLFSQTTTHSSASIPSILPGQIFCAKFTEDANFYRACVLEVIDSTQIKVLYVDFGNKEVIHVERLRVLISDFQTQPIQAYECCLDGIQPANQVGLECGLYPRSSA